MHLAMKNKIKSAIHATLFILGAIAPMSVNAQFEPQFTQYMFNEMFINPAYAGSRDQVSSTLVYRNQWVGMEGAPKTQTASINAPLMNRKLGVGLNIMNESIGVTKQFAVYGNYAYRIGVGAKGALAMGIQGGFINHQENLERLLGPNKSELHTFFALLVIKQTLPLRNTAASSGTTC
mgnify:CR=1 FL=1